MYIHISINLKYVIWHHIKKYQPKQTDKILHIYINIHVSINYKYVVLTVHMSYSSKDIFRT